MSQKSIGQFPTTSSRFQPLSHLPYAGNEDPNGGNVYAFVGCSEVFALCDELHTEEENSRNLEYSKTVYNLSKAQLTKNNGTIKQSTVL